MPESTEKEVRQHRTTERYYCPPFFSAYIREGGAEDEEVAGVEDLSLRGMKVRTSRDFEKGCDVRIKLVSNYTTPVTIFGRVRWTMPQETETASHVVGIAITKVRIIDWFKFIRLIAQIKKEVW
jgi:hypothetical protein